MTTILNSSSVAVDSFADLQSVLQQSNSYTTIYLAADIQMTAGIAILPSKTEVVIDGLYPLDGTGTVHTLTDRASADAGQTLGIRSASSISMTIQNVNILGQNYYGILYVPEGSGYAGVTVTYRNIRYTGPQITYNPSGTTRYIDCDITIDASGYSSPNELGEVYRVEIGGATTLNHTTPSGYSMFWFRGSSQSPSLTILEGAQVSLTALYDVLYTSYAVTLTVEPSARLYIDTKYGICRDSGHRFARITVDSGAQFVVDQETSRGYATLYCNGALTVNGDATFFMYTSYASSPPLVYFYATGASLVLNNPRDFVLYSYGQVVFYFLQATDVSITAHQLNHWNTASAFETAGDLDDIPAFSWRKSSDTPVEFTARSYVTGTVPGTNNFTDAELAALPDLVYLQLGMARVFSCGNLPLGLDPVTDDGHAVTGSTAPGGVVQVGYTADGVSHTLTGTADENGAFSVETVTPIPAGTALSVVANIPFLLSYATAAAQEAGAVVLDASDTLPFVIRPIAANPVLFGREDPGWSLTVTDSRARGGPWYLYAAADSPMTGSNPAHTLPDSLVLVDGGGITLLGESPTLIHTGADNGGLPLTTTVSWEPLQGILMQASSQPFYNGERYTAKITWILTEAPLEGNGAG